MQKASRLAAPNKRSESLKHSHVKCNGMAAVLDNMPRFLDVKQASEYLNLNEKKIYALVSEGRIPGTKITGKWMFPRELIDRWMLESSHGGLMTDRLTMSGGDDPLLHRIVEYLAQRTGAHGHISYTPTGTRLGLDLLQARRADCCVLHWGPDRESHLRHPALLSQFSGHRGWVLVRALRREYGLVIHPDTEYRADDLGELLGRPLRWAMRQQGSGARRLLDEILTGFGIDMGQLQVSEEVLSETAAAATVAMGLADIVPGARATAAAHGLRFIPVGWEHVDLVLRRNIYFRKLFQDLILLLNSEQTARLARTLNGYDLAEAGRLIWGQD